MIEWLKDWIIEQLSNLTMNNWIIEQLNNWTIEQLNNWTIEQLNNWTIKKLNNWTTGWLVDWLNENLECEIISKSYYSSGLVVLLVGWPWYSLYPFLFI